MSSNRRGTYVDGTSQANCQVKRVGAKHVRIVLDDGTNKLVDSKCVTYVTCVKVEPECEKDLAGRVIPTMPLEVFYRALRNLKGTKLEKFQNLHDLLNKRHGAKGANFLAELFRRSVCHSAFYSNISESFHPDRPERPTLKSKFAKKLVNNLKQTGGLCAGIRIFKYVDYEIYPYRTTLGCGEYGNPSTRTGSGGMDLLFSSGEGNLPVIGEIKAATEQVGPTFALVQALMYAAQLVTYNQFLRLKKHYQEQMGKINENTPKVDVLVLLEVDKKLIAKDIQYALSLADAIGKDLSDHIRRIVFMSCTITGETISCKEISALSESRACL